MRASNIGPMIVAHGFEPAVEIQRAAQRLEGIRENGLAAESAGLELARTQQQQLAELHRLRDLRQRLLAHQPRAQARQVAFAGRGKLAIQPLGQQQVEHRVAEEFEPLVVGPFGAAMRERDDEQRAIARRIAQPGGERFRLAGRHQPHERSGIQLITTVLLKTIEQVEIAEQRHGLLVVGGHGPARVALGDDDVLGRRIVDVAGVEAPLERGADDRRQSASRRS